MEVFAGGVRGSFDKGFDSDLHMAQPHQLLAHLHWPMVNPGRNCGCNIRPARTVLLVELFHISILLSTLILCFSFPSSHRSKSNFQSLFSKPTQPGLCTIYTRFHKQPTSQTLTRFLIKNHHPHIYQHEGHNCRSRRFGYLRRRYPSLGR